MPGRRVFFSFHYERDVWQRHERAQLRQGRRHRRGRLERRFANRKGRREIERLIDTGLRGTSVTAVLIGAESEPKA
jgi:hypothetical protein